MKPMLFALALVSPVAAHAQVYRCAVPDAAQPVRPDLPTSSQPRRVLPIGGYTLALTWAPQYCRDGADRPSSRFQCGEGNRFGFTLHGLWPDGRSKDWPQYCRPTALVPQSVIRSTLCVTPSAQLIQHEWAKHGTCMGAIRPAQYFKKAASLYARVRYPDMGALSRTSLTAGGLARAVAAANPGMRADMIRVTTSGRGWLDELWICLDTRFGYARCPVHQGGVPASAAIQIWRGTR